MISLIAKSNKPIFSQKFTKKSWHSNNLETLHFWQPDKSCYHLGHAAILLQIKRKLECRFLFLYTTILWDIWIWYFVEIFVVTSNREYFLSGSMAFLYENSQDNDESLLPQTEKIQQGPMLFPLFSMWEKNSRCLEMRHGLQYIHLRNHFSSCVKLPALDQRLCWSSLNMKEWLSRVLSVRGIWLGN